jgi:putative ABC transport system substrate-binding protein
MREVAPDMKHPAVLWNSAHPETQGELQGIQDAADRFGVDLLSLAVQRPEDFDKAFATAIEAHADAIIVVADVLINSNSERIAQFALDQGLPSIFHDRKFVEDGGLMSYGPERTQNYWRAATYVDRLIKGADPSVMPIEQPDRFQLIINQKTARQIARPIPPALLLEAVEVLGRSE